MHMDVQVTLDVRKDNAAALALYSKLGFVVTDEPSGNGETDAVMAVTMRKLLGIVETPRLMLKRITARDVSEGIQIYRDNRVNKTYMFPDLTEEAGRKMHDRLSAISANDSRYVRGIYLGNKMVGFINDPEILDSTIELGWVVDPVYHNQGYATEAVTYAIEDLFSRGYTEVTAGAFEENPASIRVMQKSGMHLIEKTEEIDYRGRIHHCIFYAIERETQ
jgi:RimJ/RimL family protein N-acetyltransferase